LTGAFRPYAPLAAAQGTLALGAWQLTVADVSAGDTGRLGMWRLEVCGADIVQRLMFPVINRQ
jgi:subtilisin-like proprotein convertase family protein